VVGQPIVPDSSAEAIAYAAAEATVESTKAALDAATTDLNAATNALNVAEGTWTLSSSQYNRDLNLGTPDYYVAVRQSSGDLYLVLWNNGTVQLANQYRRGNFVTTGSIGRGAFNVIDYYRIEEWTFDTSAVTAAESAYNAALSAYTTAETNYTNALSSRDAALATWQASVTYAAEIASSGDICGKRISDCRLRFGAEAELPFGSFPGAGLTQ